MSSSIYEIKDGKDRVLALIASRTDRTGDCWLWNGNTAGRGYGKFSMDNTRLYAHRASYEAHHGPITKGLHVLHSCDTPACVKPEHLRVGTHQENMRDRDERGRHGQTSKTHCPQGHPYDGGNTRRLPGERGRACRACQRESMREWRRKNGENSKPERYFVGPKTECVNGHPYDETNTVRRKDGKRECLNCKRASAREWARKNSTKAGAR